MMISPEGYYVVFVEDDGTEWYHKFECSRFKGAGWVFNTEMAQSLGYTACPVCH